MVKKYVAVLNAVFSILVVSGFASAYFSVSTLYSENYKLNLKLGDSEIIFFNIRNVAAEQNIEVVAEVVSGFEIASLVDISKVYSISPKERVEIPVLIEIPLDYGDVNEPDVSLIFRQVSDSNSRESVGFITSITKSLPIKIEGAGAEQVEITNGDQQEKFIDESPVIDRGEKRVVLLWWMILSSLSVLIVGVIFIIIIFYRREKQASFKYTS